MKQKIIHIQITKISVILMLLMLFSSCAVGDNAHSVSHDSSNGSYIVKYDNNIYYYDMKNTSSMDVSLHKYDLSDGTDEQIGKVSISPEEGAFAPGMARMFCFDGRLYYGKVMNTRSPNIEIYSIDAANPGEPFYEGCVSDYIKAFYSDLVVHDFRIFKIGNDLYVLCSNKLYKVSPKKSELVSDNISSIYIDNRDIYYALCKDGSTQTESVNVYNTDSKENKLLLSGETLNLYNLENSVYGDSACVRNITKYKDKLLFNGATLDVSYSKVYSYSIGETKSIETIDGEYLASPMFKVYGDKLYFINYFDHSYNLCGMDMATKEIQNIIPSVYTYAIYDNVIYYYGMHPDGNLELRKYDIASGTDTGLLQ